MILIEFYGMDVNGSDRDMGPILLNPEDISAVVSVPGGPGTDILAKSPACLHWKKQGQ